MRYVPGYATGYTDANTEQAICDRYETESNVGRLSATFGLHESTVYAILRRNKVELRGKNTPTQAQEEAICRQYREGKSGPELAREWGFGRSTVKRVLRRGGVVRAASEAHRTHTCDDHFFDVIDTEVKAYWLGFIAADGCVTGNALSIGLQARDREHLELLKATLNATNPVMAGRSGKGFPTATLYITSQTLVAALERNGVVRRKSKVLAWPNELDSSLLRHYLRGYSDGDGWFNVARSAYVRKRDGQRGSILNWGIIGTDAFCADASRFLKREANVSDRPPEPHPVSAGMSLLKYGGNLQVSRIYRLLYDGASVWLPRKRDTAKPHLRLTRQTWSRPELRALSEVDVEEVRRLRGTGVTLQKIADHYGVSGSTIRSVVPPTRLTPPLTPDEVRHIRKLYEEGRANHAQLAARFGVGTSTIGRVIRNEGRWAGDLYD